MIQSCQSQSVGWSNILPREIPCTDRNGHGTEWSLDAMPATSAYDVYLCCCLLLRFFLKLSLSLPFPSSKFSHRPLPALLQILNLFFINCYFMHICICIHILKHNMLLACMLSGLTIYTRQPTGMLFSGRTTLSLSELLVVLCPGLRPHGLFPSQSGMLVGVLVWLMFGPSYW